MAMDAEYSSEPATMVRPRNHHVQALRGIAASLVVLSHAIDVIVEHRILPEWFRPVAFSIGGLGVTTFFVISGFVMVTISYGDFGSFSKSLGFAKRRLIRIVPTYWIATFVAFALYQIAPLSREPSIIELVKSLTFIPYPTGPGMDMQPVLGQGWTLNYEMFFYALFTVALILPRRIGLTGVFLVFCAVVAEGSLVKPFSNSTPAQTVFTFFADPIILLFAAGMAIGVLKHHLGRRFVLRYPFWIAVALLVAQILVNIVFRIPSRLPFPEVISIWIAGAVAVAACAFAAPVSGGRFETIAEALGDASYSTYLFHIFLVAGLKMVLPITTVTAVFFVLAALLLSNLFGLVFYRTIERPISALLRGSPIRRMPLPARIA
ncbi:acyltransferase [Mesorhizobium sp. M0977]|uniref:acyltransferase family protein n=1 Tax=Mesorhizobium sp. M0977 TaxID=2957039 RepID=UPI00333A426D